ncbi:MAG: hypothetical protein ACP5R5_14115, partial [Armatimonadota bacterium]
SKWQLNHEPKHHNRDERPDSKPGRARSSHFPHMVPTRSLDIWFLPDSCPRARRQITASRLYRLPGIQVFGDSTPVT